MASWTPLIPCSTILSLSVWMVIRVRPKIAASISGSQSMGTYQNHSWGYFKILVIRPHPSLLDLFLMGGSKGVCIFGKFYRWFWCTTQMKNFCWRHCALNLGMVSVASLVSPQPPAFPLFPCHCGARVPMCLAPESSRVVIVEGQGALGGKIQNWIYICLECYVSLSFC